MSSYGDDLKHEWCAKHDQPAGVDGDSCVSCLRTERDEEREVASLESQRAESNKAQMLQIAQERDEARKQANVLEIERNWWKNEFEKAEAERDELQGKLDHEIECWKNERKKLIRSRKEIARIPEWLREEGTPHEGWNEKHRGILDSIASMIERGKHLKGMKDE